MNKPVIINGKKFFEYPEYHCVFCGAIQATKFKRSEAGEIIGFEIDSESHIPDCKQYEK